MKKVKEFIKINWYKILLVFLVLMVYVVSISIALAKDIPNNANDIKSDLISLSSYNNEVVNLASPSLEGKEYLGNGNYLLFTERGLTLSYNVFTGIFTREGNLEGTSFEYPLIFNIQGNQTLTISSYIVDESSSHTQIWEKPNRHLLDITNNTFSFRTSSQFKYIFLNFNEIDLLDLEQFKLQIEIGDTATNYQVPISALEKHEQFIYNKGNEEGYTRGRNDGYNLGEREGYDEGYDRGFIDGTSVNFEGAYDKGFDDGRVLGYDEGYGHGYDLGQEIGWDTGYELGMTKNPNNNFGSMITSILLGVGTVLGIELLPNITIGAIIAVPIVFGIIAFVLGRKKE